MPKDTRGGKRVSALSDAEKTAIEWYVSGDGMWINQYLRGRGDFGELSSQERKFLSDLEKATDRALPETTLYRSVDAEAIFGSMSDGTFEDLSTLINYGQNAFGKGAYADNLRNKLNSIIKNAEGKTITEKGFMSTSKSYDVASDWGDFTGSNKPIVLEIKTGRKTKGVDASYTDRYADGEPQKEVLLNNNQKLKINSVGSRNGQIYVKCTMN